MSARQAARRTASRLRVAIPLAAAALAAAVVVALSTDLFRDLSLVETASMIRSWGFWAPAASVGLMVVQAVVAPIPAFLITAANGLVFGVWGILVSWVGAMLGAVVTFGIGRTFSRFALRRIGRNQRIRGYVDRLTDREAPAEPIDASRVSARRPAVPRPAKRYGAKVVLIARLLPFVSFDLVSYAAGVSAMRLTPFLVATGAGMLPATVVYTLVGSQAHRLDHYSNWLLIGGIALSVGVVAYSLIEFFLGRRLSPPCPDAGRLRVDMSGDSP